MSKHNTTVTNFSRGYYLVDVDTVEFSGERVTIPYQLGDRLANYVTKPLFKIGDEYVWPEEARDIPARTAALPSNSEIPPNGKILMAKERTTADLLLRDQVPEPR